MKHVNPFIVRAAIMLVVGLLLILFPSDAARYLVIAVGLAFIIPAIVLLVAYFSKKKDERAFFPIEVVGSLLFGLILIVSPDFFITFLTIIIGFLLVLGGIYQLAVLLSARKWTRVPAYCYVVPVLVILAGLFAVFNTIKAIEVAFIVIGITSIVYALAEFAFWFCFYRKRPKVEDAVVVEEITVAPDAPSDNVPEPSAGDVPPLPTDSASSADDDIENLTIPDID